MIILFKMKIRDSSNFENLCEELAEDCHYYCPVSQSPFSCPFSSHKCCKEVTKEDWMSIIKEIKE